MEITPLLFTAILPIFLVVAAGFLARRLEWLDPSADQSIMRVVLNLLYPALIFSFILENPALRQTANLLLPPLFGFSSVVAGMVIALLLARFLGLGNSREQRTFAFITGMYNYSYLPVPIVAALFGRETTGVLIVSNLGVEIALWVLGIGFILSAHDSKPLWKRILSGPIIAILIAVPINSLGWSAALPSSFYGAVELLGGCAIPVGLILIGATIADLARGIQWRARSEYMFYGISLRMLLLPSLVILTAWCLPFSIELKRVMVIQGAMPCAIFPIVLARHFDGASEIALKVALSTTALSLVTIPLWIGFGLYLIGN
jgi:predicted permease